MKREEYVKRVDEVKIGLYRVAYGYMNDKTSAMDVLDEAVYKGYIHCGKLKDASVFRAWITRIVVNECLMKLRKDKKLLFTDQIPEEAVEPVDHLPLKEALHQLPGELHSIISLRYFGGYTLSETAKILELPLGTVVSRERRALHMLRLELEDGIREVDS